jgi:hypothetical protein
MTARVRRSGPVERLLERAWVPADRTGGHVPPTGGTYCSPHRIDLVGGARLVLEVPPSPDVPGLTYEAGLLCGEALFHAPAATAGGGAGRGLLTRDGAFQPCGSGCRTMIGGWRPWRGTGFPRPDSAPQVAGSGRPGRGL